MNREFFCDQCCEERTGKDYECGTCTDILCEDCKDLHDHGDKW